MKKELPKVYANNIDKKFNNVQELFYGLENNRNTQKKITKEELTKKLNNIFSSPNHVYKSKVFININGTEEEKIIVGRNSNSIFTLEGEIINLSEILDIKKGDNSLQ